MNKTPIANTPVMKQFLEVKRKYHDTIVLFRMGDFYETFLDDAILTSKILGIVLTKRANGKAANVDLAGFPYHALDNYLPKLVKAGHRVAICEQVEDPKLAKGIVKREVIEVVTPGTLTSDKTLNDKSNRFIGSLSILGNNSGVAFLDSSTGEFYIGECLINQLNNMLLRFSPQEMLISEKIIYSNLDWYIKYKPFVTQIESQTFDFDRSYRILTKHFKVTSLKSFGCETMSLGITAAGALMKHIKSNLSSTLKHTSKLTPIIHDGFMGIDEFTMKNLEVFQSLSSQGAHGTLIDCIDMTLTAGGGRLLRRNLMNPMNEKKKIIERLNMVEAFLDHPSILKKIRKSLYKAADLERILGKINKGKVSPRDIVSMSVTLGKLPEWNNFLSSPNNHYFNTILDSFCDTDFIVNKVNSTLNEIPPLQLSKGNIIKEGVEPELDELRMLLSNGKEWICSFQENMRKELDIPKLKIGFNKVFGYYIEITKVHQNKVPQFFIRKQTLVNSERYITDELKEYEEKILNAEEKIFDIESQIFNTICEFILSHINLIHKNADIINHLDLCTSFSNLALKRKYIKPTLTNKAILKIKNGRHPVVEQLLPATEKFIPNDLCMDVNKNQIHLLTGPNMAGKSTYLRQIGLIVIMGQIGSFVPASKAKIGIVDHLFTRVGASDNLAGGESTFLVEMHEAANILNNATNNSLVLLDEIGRGTSTYDGLSIAWAITEHLHNEDNINARTVFATHYHELTDLENSLERLENHHVEVKEFGDSIIFLRSIAKGPGDKSYGIYVGKMAGLPDSVISRASEILDYHLQRTIKDSNLLTATEKDSPKKLQEGEDIFRNRLNEIDINALTPLQALKKLDKLKKDFDV